jgi:hypothetical protein
MQFSCRSFQTRRRMDKRLTRCAVAQRSHMAASPIGFMERGWLWSELYVRQGAHCHRRHVVGRDEEHFPRAWVEVIRRLAVRKGPSVCCQILLRNVPRSDTALEVRQEVAIRIKLFSCIIGTKKTERFPTLGSGLRPAGAIPRIGALSLSRTLRHRPYFASTRLTGQLVNIRNSSMSTALHKVPI